MDSSTSNAAPTFETLVAAYVDALNARVQELRATGVEPLYKEFGATIGRKHARIFAVCGSSRSARAFLGRDGMVRRSDSWKAAGRLLGSPTDAIGYILAAHMAAPKR